MLGHNSAVRAVAVAADGQTFASGGEDGRLVVWNPAAGRKRPQLIFHRARAGPITAVALSADGPRAVGAWDSEQTARVWDAEMGNELFVLEGHDGAVTCVAFSPTEPMLATASRDGTVTLWDSVSGKRRCVLANGAKQVVAVAFSPDGQSLAAGLNTGAVVLWDVSTQQMRTTLQAHSSPARIVAFSPEGRSLVTAGLNEPVKLWDAATGEERLTIGESRAPGQNILGAAFTPDGGAVAVAVANVGLAGPSGAVQFWDAVTGTQLSVLPKTSPVSSIAFSADGSTMITGQTDGTLCRWSRVQDR
jgi:WD40 repeat protein